MGDIANVGPVEKVGVVADLPMRLTPFPDIIESSSALPVARTDRAYIRPLMP